MLNFCFPYSSCSGGVADEQRGGGHSSQHSAADGAVSAARYGGSEGARGAQHLHPQRYSSEILGLQTHSDRNGLWCFEHVLVGFFQHI